MLDTKCLILVVACAVLILGVVAVLVASHRTGRADPQADRFIENKYAEFRKCAEESGDADIPSLEEYKEYVSSLGFSTYDDVDDGTSGG